jgi:hypothetical protein
MSGRCIYCIDVALILDSGYLEETKTIVCSWVNRKTYKEVVALNYSKQCFPVLQFVRVKLSRTLARYSQYPHSLQQVLYHRGPFGGLLLVAQGWKTRRRTLQL